LGARRIWHIEVLLPRESSCGPLSSKLPPKSMPAYLTRYNSASFIAFVGFAKKGARKVTGPLGKVVAVN
jgi:hypothetical protein